MRLGSLLLAAFSCAACDAEEGDPSTSRGVPPPEGRDARIREITDPSSAAYPKGTTNVAVSGAVVVAVDDFDETQNGRSRGTVFVQDLGSGAPFSGISLFAPTFVPGNLKVGVGDVLDLRGVYQENRNIGSAVFADGAVLPQLAQPTAIFRYEFRPPDPVDIDVRDLASFEVGRRWLGMVVRVRDVTIQRAIAPESVSNGRLTVDLLPREGAGACDAPFPKPPSLTNELTDLSPLRVPEGTTLRSITGIVTFFCNLRLAPRTASDVVR